MAALASAASVLAAFVHSADRARARPAVRRRLAAELVVQGRVLAPDHRPLTPAVVTVLQTEGEPVDWSRVDTEGNYSVALPGAGKYLVVANAAGWAPMAEVFDFDGRTLKQNFLLADRLEIRGRAAVGGAARGRRRGDAPARHGWPRGHHQDGRRRRVHASAARRGTLHSDHAASRDASSRGAEVRRR